jgi:hypothetical protein
MIKSSARSRAADLYLVYIRAAKMGRATINKVETTPAYRRE